jgi:hypothetical protein
MHQAQFLMGEVGGFLSAVDEIVASTAGYSALCIVRLASSSAGTRQAVMSQYAGFRIAIAIPGDPYCAFAASGRFAKIRHTHPHILLRQRESGRGGFLSSTSCALTVHVIKSGFKLRSTFTPR